jgi:DNA-binding protein HU-beta
MIFNKADLVESIAESASISKAEAGRQLDNVMGGFKAQLAKMKPEDKIQLVGNMTVEVTHKPAHVAKNPRTKEDVKVPAKNSVKIKAGSEFIEAVK